MTRAPSVVLAIGIALVSAQPALAQVAGTAQKSLPVTGNAPEVCTLQPARIRTGELVNFNGLDGDTLQIQQLVDAQTLAARPARITVTFGAVCNYPHQVRLQSQNNGLWPTDARQATLAPGFATALPYDARLQWADKSGVLQADAKVRGGREQRLTIDTASAGDLLLSLRIEAGASNTLLNAPVLAGVYGDTLRIFLEPR